MTDRDYNEPRRDYTSPEEDRYSRPNYETAEEYNQARREQQAQSDAQSSSYSTLGGQMVDGDGAPIPNYFAVQMVFAIVEILGCCCMNIGTMVLGIIALVFATQANTAYNQRRVEEYKSKSKVSTILLIIGGVWMSISILFNLFALGGFVSKFEDFDGEFEEIIEDLEDYEYYDDYDGEYTGTDEEPLVDGFESFTYNGVAYSVPMSFDEFEQMGFALDEEYEEDEDIDGGNYEWFYFYNDKDMMVGEIRVYNTGDEDRVIHDCEIIYICFYNEAIYDDEAEPMDLSFACGLDMNATYEEIEAFMGVPTYTYAPEDGVEYARYSWYYYGDNGEYESFNVTFWDGKLEDISIEVSQY